MNGTGGLIIVILNKVVIFKCINGKFINNDEFDIIRFDVYTLLLRLNYIYSNTPSC
jgi:hypothetical protein